MRVRGVVTLLVVLIFAGALQGWAATGRVVKVLPHFKDVNGRTALSPSLFERDAYQDQLRKNPKQRAGLRFDVHYRTRGGTFEPLKMRVELRGTAEGNLPKTEMMEKTVKRTGHFSRWTSLDLDGDRYKQFGEVTAWRVTLWEGDQKIGEQTSFLW